MFAVGVGYNSLFVTLGVFDTEEKMGEVLTKMGAKWVPEGDYTKSGKDSKGIPWSHTHHEEKHWEITKEFSENMDKLDLSWYSTGGPMEEWQFDIKEFEPNKIVFGYDDD